MINTNRDEEILLQISKAIGPSPWYWNIFSNIVTPSGETLKWSFLGTEGKQAYIVGLSSANKAETFKFLLNTYTRAFFVPPYYIGIWFPTKEDIRIQCFNPDKLKEFELDDQILRYKHEKKPYYCDGEIECEVIINSSINIGSFKIEIPKQLKTLNEILIIKSTHVAADNEGAYTILALNTNQNIIEAYPQNWFNTKQFDIGYQWITRITRDENTGRFIGDGIRIGKFELCDDSMNLLRWVLKEV